MGDTAKIVYNGCYGGFGLSPAAQQAYAKRKGFELFFYKQTAYSHRDGRDEYTKTTEADDSLFVSAVRVDAGEKPNKLPSGHDEWFWDNDIPRNDPDLIAVIEEMGDAANGRCASLHIKELPKGTLYRIDEYDGSESVMTNSDYEWQQA